MTDERNYERKTELLRSYTRQHATTVLLANYSGQTGAEMSAGKSRVWSETGQLVAAKRDGK